MPWTHISAMFTSLAGSINSIFLSEPVIIEDPNKSPGQLLRIAKKKRKDQKEIRIRMHQELLIRRIKRHIRRTKETAV
ncbi:Protein CBG25783 [Caenorhabditis briggsae]|nr:Protein CBG25783 [Caenorhabditis briggsae]CAR99036.1 Protein CBG25783 [Caenorhabditis briggsae]